MFRPPQPPWFKSHVLFPLLRSYQRIMPGPRRFETFRNNNNFFSPTPNPQAGGPPLVGCPWLPEALIWDSVRIIGLVEF
jgi:hypothetical protein